MQTHLNTSVKSTKNIFFLNVHLIFWFFFSNLVFICFIPTVAKDIHSITRLFNPLQKKEKVPYSIVFFKSVTSELLTGWNDFSFRDSLFNQNVVFVM